MIQTTNPRDRASVKWCAMETAFSHLVAQFLKKPVAEALADLYRQLRQPTPSLFDAAVKDRKRVGATPAESGALPPLSPEECTPPGIVHFTALPPTRTLADLEGTLRRRIILEKASVAPENFGMVIGRLELQEASRHTTDPARVRNGACDALSQEENYGLRDQPVTQAEWAWAEYYDACLGCYLEIDRELEAIRSGALEILDQVADRYSVRVSAADLEDAAGMRQFEPANLEGYFTHRRRTDDESE